MKKFLNTLFDDFPELKNDRKKIEKLVYLLDKNKPNIEASKNFKKDLKQRVQNYWELKSTSSKKNYLLFFIPTLSFCFAVFGLAYFSDDFFIFDKDKNYSKITQENDFWIEETQKKSIMRNMNQEEKSDNLENSADQDNFSTNSQETMIVWDNYNNLDENNDSEDIPSDNQVDSTMPVWWWLEESQDPQGYQASSDMNEEDSMAQDSMNQDLEQESFSQDESIQENQMMMQTFMIESSTDNNEKTEFELYCELENWIYWFEDDWFYCKLEMWTCYEKDFENGVCEKFE